MVNGKTRVLPFTIYYLLPLKCGVLVLAQRLLDDGLAFGVVAGGGDGVEAALGDVLAAAGADAVAALVDAQQRLVDVGDGLRGALAQAVLYLLAHVLDRLVGHVLDAVVVGGKLESVVLVPARRLALLPQLFEQHRAVVVKSLLVHRLSSMPRMKILLLGAADYNSTRP